MAQYEEMLEDTFLLSALLCLKLSDGTAARIRIQSFSAHPTTSHTLPAHQLRISSYTDSEFHGTIF